MLRAFLEESEIAKEGGEQRIESLGVMVCESKLSPLYLVLHCHKSQSVVSLSYCYVKKSIEVNAVCR